MKKILFPIDFSKASLNAFVYALQLAKKIDAEIVTLHVYPIDVAVFSDYSGTLSINYSINEWSDFEHYKSKVPKLKKLAEEFQAGSIRISHLLDRGDVIEKILEKETLENADYIVLGTNGATGLEAVFLGTVAESVINRAKGIVLAIPAACSFSGMHNILLLAKYEKPYLKILNQVLGFAKTFNTHVDVLQIKDAANKQEARTMKDWSRKFADDDVSFHILATNSLEETAIRFADEHHDTVVALAVHEKGFFEKLFFFSLSRRMTFHSKIPVMAIHCKKLQTP